jgi:HEAT repeat protein
MAELKFCRIHRRRMTKEALMKRHLISLAILGTFIGSAVCLAQSESEIPAESAESAIEVAPDQVQLPAELEEQLDRLFDLNEVFVSEALFKTLTNHTRASSSRIVRLSSTDDRPPRPDLALLQEIHNRLRQGLTCEHLEIRRRAALALNALGDNSGVPVLMEDMAAADPSDRATVALAPRKIKDQRAIPALIKAVDDKIPYIRCIAIEALGEMKAGQAYDVIVKHLSDKEKVKAADVIMVPAGSACFALGEIGERKAVPLLIEALEDEELTEPAAKALEKIKLGRIRYFGRGSGDSGFGTDVNKWTGWWQREHTEKWLIS